MGNPVFNSRQEVYYRKRSSRLSVSKIDRHDGGHPGQAPLRYVCRATQLIDPGYRKAFTRLKESYLAEDNSF